MFVDKVCDGNVLCECIVVMNVEVVILFKCNCKVFILYDIVIYSKCC